MSSTRRGIVWSPGQFFAQILSLIDRADFARSVRHHAAERAAKVFSCWDHFVAVLFCPRGSAHSLREICVGLATALDKLVHLGVRPTPTRSTLRTLHTTIIELSGQGVHRIGCLIVRTARPSFQIVESA